MVRKSLFYGMLLILFMLCTANERILKVLKIEKVFKVHRRF
jgi:hypothetical protein